MFLTIAAAFAEAERDRIRERIRQVKADQRARGRYLGGNVPFGLLLQDGGGGSIPHEAEQDAIREMVALRAAPEDRHLGVDNREAIANLSCSQAMEFRL